MAGRRAREERAAALRARLLDVRVADHWQECDPTRFVDVAVRRWTSSGRRIKPAQSTPDKQIQDLLRGFRESLGDDLTYEEPGWLEHLAERFGAALLAADQEGIRAASGSRRETPTP
jgi:hypothetical protein